MLNWVDKRIAYGDSVVIESLELSVKQGEKLAILGPSGAGKTTLLEQIYQALRQQACLCAQSQGLVENLSLYHNVFMGALGRHNSLYNLVNLVFPFRRPRLQVKQLCELLELDADLSEQVQYLSGGQRQRVALARALYQEQAIFIGDEPFSALDPSMAERLLVRVLARHQSAICVLHDPVLALAHFDRIVVFHAGIKVFDGLSSSLTLAQLRLYYSQDKWPDNEGYSQSDPLNQAVTLQQSA
jgi:phosphonate transport system ATP-binding protein